MLFKFKIISLAITLLLFLRNRPAFDEPMDAIVYATLLSLGFATLENFDYIYCFYTCNTITVRECIQQIGRIRNLRKNDVNIYIKNIVKKEIEYNIINIKYDLENNVNNIFYKQSISDINNILKLLKFNINKMGYKNIDIKNGINYLIIYSLYEKNINLKKYIELMKKKLYITNN